MTKDKILENLKKDANYAHRQFPQYAGHWDAWVLGRITKKISTKGGLAFEKGDVVLVNPNSLTYQIPEGPKKGIVSPTCYSFRCKVDCSLGGNFVEII